ncbi:MAG TPA: P63C domain-containing protein [Falsiroseomonas sp.]|nr:P63C domain-containing protein [Falsiroseomonas sp.]
MDRKVPGRARSGLARAAKLTRERRSAIASDAATKRWEEQRARLADRDTPRVLEGFSDVVDVGGMKIPCAVIEGPNGIQRVLSENGITNALLGSRSGASKRKKGAMEDLGAPVPLFVAPKQLFPFIDKELLDGPLKPIDYRHGDRIVRGYDARILPAVCKVWLRARHADALQEQQLAKAKKAEILLWALADTGIVALIDEATGYEKVRPQNALQEYLKVIVREQLAAWVQRFPEEFFHNIYTLRGWAWPGMKKNRYSVVAHYIKDLVYRRLGPGVLDELERKSPKNEKGRRPNKLHQWLTDDVGHPMLAQHLHAIIMFQRVAIVNGYSWDRFVRMVDAALPKKGATLELPFNDPLGPNERPQPSGR